MVIAVDFDSTIVKDDGFYNTASYPQLLFGAKEALESLKAAGHILVLWSARSNRAFLYNPYLDPLIRNGLRKVNFQSWEEDRVIHIFRYKQMIDFVNKELPNIFDAIDDGYCGKLYVDMFIDDKALRFGGGLNGTDWQEISKVYGIAK